MRRFWRQLRRRWVLGLLALLIISGMIAAGVLTILIVTYGREDRAQPADVIIVLGGGRSGTQRRSHHAAVLYEEGLAPYVLCSGGAVANARMTEAERCRRTLVRRGVPSEAIILETRSLSTEENAIESAAIMREHGWQDAVLVSDDFHLWRAHIIFEDYGIQVWPSPAQITDHSMSVRDRSLNVGREVAASVWYGVKSALDLPYTRVGD
jgi:uncharacterized SAM-binding protein YcdF (DUF218 family)